MRKSQNEPCRPILVIRILLDNDCVRACFSNLLFADVPFHRTSESMLGEVEFAFSEFQADLLQRLHYLLWSTMDVSLGHGIELEYPLFSLMHILKQAAK